MGEPKKQWEGTTYGNVWMHNTLIGILRNTDIRFWYVFMAIFVIPICLLTRKKGRQVIYHYFRSRYGYSRIKSAWLTCMNHYVFGQVVVDRFAMYAGKSFRIQIEGYEHFETLAARDEGFIQLSAHIGNYELAGYSLVAKEKRFNALVFFGEKETVMENRMKMFKGNNIRMIPIKPDMSHLFVVDQALRDGEIISMPADRVFGSPKYITRTLLGEQAHLPLGPFSVATLRGLDVIAVNVMKISWNTYKVYVTPLAYPKDTSRKEQVEVLSAAYVKELERIVRMYPTQWFNYYDYWKQ